MRSGKTFEIRVGYLKECCGAAELTVRVHRYNYEPPIVDIRACTFCGEVYNRRVYLSWLMRVSWQELGEFARRYLS
jgi:hypothetical protein